MIESPRAIILTTAKTGLLNSAAQSSQTIASSMVDLLLIRVRTGSGFVEAYALWIARVFMPLARILIADK